jgi:hypothetical protein
VSLIYSVGVLSAGRAFNMTVWSYVVGSYQRIRYFQKKRIP